MKPKTFTEVVQAVAFIIILAVFGYKVIVDPSLKDALTNVLMLGAGFWWGSSRSSQLKDNKEQP